MSARSPAGATFEISRVGGTRSRPPLPAILAGAVVVAIVGFGLLGRLAEAGRPQNPADASVVPASTGVAQLAALVPAPGDHVLLADPIDLRWPAVGPITITTAHLSVVGTVLVHAATVKIALEARGNHIISGVTVSARDPNGGIRPDQLPVFHADFAIPFPRPNDTMWVVVTAYDASGIPLGGERRPFYVGPISESATGSTSDASSPYATVDAPPLDQKRCGPAVSPGWRCG